MIGRGIEAMPLGEVGVDSGTVLIVDPCHVREEGGLELPEELADLIPGEAPGVPVATPSGVNVAVVSHTADGDGVFPVYMLKQEGQPVGLFVDFLVRETLDEEPPDPL